MAREDPLLGLQVQVGDPRHLAQDVAEGERLLPEGRIQRHRVHVEVAGVTVGLHQEAALRGGQLDLGDVAVAVGDQVWDVALQNRQVGHAQQDVDDRPAADALDGGGADVLQAHGVRTEDLQEPLALDVVRDRPHRRPRGELDRFGDGAHARSIQ